MIVWRWVGRDASGVFLINSRGNSSRDRAEGGAGGALAPPTFLQEQK